MKTLALLLLLAPAAVAADEPLRLEAHDRIVFLGDSITHAGFYVEPIETMLWSFFPDLELEFFNAGVSGDVAAQAAERLDAEVLEQDPDVVLVLLGMNDAGYVAFDPARLERYREGMNEIVTRLVHETEAEVVLLSPTFYDPVAAANPAPDYNATLVRYGEVCRELARENGCRFIDLNRPMQRATDLMRAQDPKFSLTHDGVHPDAGGGLVIADAVLQGLLVEVDPEVLELRPGTQPVRLTRFPVALLPESVEPLAKAIRFPERWSAYVLDPSALPEGQWRVTIGGGEPVEVVGGHEAEATPIAVDALEERARELRRLNQRRRQVIATDIRDAVQLVKSEPNSQTRSERYARMHTETLKLAWIKVRELEKRIRELLEPVDVEIVVERAE